jgi:hypothetical protein
MGMRPDLMRPVPEEKPLVGDVAAVQGHPMGPGQERDQEIIMMLRQRLKERQGNMYDTSDPPARKRTAGEEDKYEPQRISRKICWQYDSSAKRVPLLRRHYI